ncbi:MAG: S8 family serine peptidase [Prevotella sp.]|nr:S8 family serine peptidase [Prevotella sp.]
MEKKSLTLLTFLLLLLCTTISAQTSQYRKMSSMVRQAYRESRNHTTHKSYGDERNNNPELYAFVKIDGDAGAVLSDHSCRLLDKQGEVCIAAIPLRVLKTFVADKRVMRIEANEPCTITMDTTGICVGATDVYSSLDLPQAFTGKGVVVGLEDIGFDLTHPTFWTKDMSEYRVRRFWDHLAADTMDTKMPVGQEYTTREAILAYAHSRDGLIAAHGTHTAGIAVGSGYDTPYRGIAWESDICLVANVTTSNASIIEEEYKYKFTDALDALGFKYAFDYAASVGKPCVVSFSEGSKQGFEEDDKLMYEYLAELVGPGRILVASAGNEGMDNTYYHKERGVESKGSFMIGGAQLVYFTMKADAPFTVRSVLYSDEKNDTILLRSSDIFLQPDSEYIDTLQTIDGLYAIDAAGYPSCYNENDTAYEMVIKCLTAKQIGGRLAAPLSVEMVGADADVSFFVNSAVLVPNSLNPDLNAGEPKYNVYTPGTAPCAICVGATAYRKGVWNEKGEWRPFNQGENGQKAPLSSVGPTYDERIKPDVMAPGVNIISAYSSFYEEENPDANSTKNKVATSEYNGRYYGWTKGSGTSMSTPVVAGGIALWLQARPKLTPEQVMEVIKKTSTHYDESLQYPNNDYGYGQIDIYRGLLEVLKFPYTGIEQADRHLPNDVKTAVNGDKLILAFNDVTDKPLRLTIYSTNGIKIAQHTIPAGSSQYDAPLTLCQPGNLYIVHISGSKPLTGSTIIRY